MLLYSDFYVVLLADNLMFQTNIIETIRTETSNGRSPSLLFQVDRGLWGCEILLIVWCYQLWCPGSVHVNRGNHEDQNMNERDRAIGGKEI
jgi:hypothetical protein